MKLHQLTMTRKKGTQNVIATRTGRTVFRSTTIKPKGAMVLKTTRIPRRGIVCSKVEKGVR